MFDVDETFGHLPAIERARIKRERARAILVVSLALAALVLGGLLRTALGFPVPY